MQPTHLKEAKKAPDESTVSLLKSLLKQAEDGEIIGVAVAAQFTGAYFSFSWACSDLEASTVHLVGALETLKGRMVNALLDD
jgi:hypothetical protein